MNEIFIVDDAFGKAEQKGRKIWYDFLTKEYPDILEYIEFTPTKYDKVDGYMKLKGNDKIITFEIKRRNILSTATKADGTKYADEGYILEKIKYDALWKDYQKGNDGWYINIFDDCMMIWDISTILPTFEWVNCTGTTVVNYQKGAVPKLCHLLTPDEKPIYTIV